jgi:DNA invertase Pin-like site-specific DNA recombinase
MKPVAIYARVSTTKNEQERSIENQIQTLKEYCRFREWESEVFAEQKSGMKDETKRPELARLMEGVRLGKFSGIVVTNTSRLGRNPLQMIKLWYELQSLKVNFTAVMDGIDTTSPAGELIFVMFAVLGKMNRTNIVDNVNHGLDKARAKGKVLGRKRKDVDVLAVKAYRAAGNSLRKCQAEFGINKTTVKTICEGGANLHLATPR